MGRHQHDELDHGFNLSLTRDNLLQRLLANRAIKASRRPIPPIPDATLPMAEREEALWRRAEAAAMIHADQHGTPGRTLDGKGKKRMLRKCRTKRCRAAALSFALYELCQYWRDRHGADLRLCVDEIHTLLCKLDSSVPVVLARAATELLEGMDEQQRIVLAKAAEQDALGNQAGATELRQAQANADEMLGTLRSRRVLARQVGETLGEMVSLVAALKRSTGNEESPHRPLRSKARRGRRKESLLSAVVQHLAHGRFERRDVISMVADIDGGATTRTRNALKERIRGRRRSNDCRTISPEGKRNRTRDYRPPKRRAPAQEAGGASSKLPKARPRKPRGST